ncbi:MAG TPA: hypothetical protein VMW80_09955 [Candidatus Dormibacteraeota bacterium]|nr:hypothetical protein [Candidatus Dormibacteraeota bacterium]
MADLRRLECAEEEVAVEDDGHRCHLRWWMVDPEAVREGLARQEEQRREFMRQLDELAAGR